MFSDAIRALLHGEVIALPTEAVYGLSADPRNEMALQALLRLKHRDPSKGLILVGSDFSQLEPFIEPLSPEVYDRITKTWPGPYTWVVPAQKNLSRLLCGKHETLAIRVTAHPLFAQLCAAFGGPLVSTSANVEGQPPAMTEQEVRQYFGDSLVIVPGQLGGLATTTQIREGLTGKLIR